MNTPTPLKTTQLFRNNRIINSGFPFKVNTFRFILLAQEKVRNLPAGQNSVFISYNNLKKHHPKPLSSKNIKKIGNDIMDDIRANNFIRFNSQKYHYVDVVLINKIAPNDNGITIDFNKILEPYIKTENNYRQQSLLEINQHNSGKAAQLYCLLEGYRDKKTVYKSIKTLRDQLFIDKNELITSNQFTRMIRRKVIDINSKNDIKVEFEPEKESRKTVGYYFQITSKNQVLLAEKKELTTEQRLKKLKVSSKQIKEIIKRNIEANIIEALNITELAFKEKIINHEKTVSYLIGTLKKLNTNN